MVPCGTVTDIDGVTYETVQIGSQCWMAEELRNSTCRDGSTIANITDAAAWWGGQLSIDKAPFDLEPHTQDLLERFAVVLETSRILVSVPPGLPRVMGDPGRLERVSRLNEALLETGLEGEVSLADCAEFPCLMVGETADPLDREDWRALAYSSAMQSAYESDTVVGFRGPSNVEDGGGHVFGVAVFPRRDAASHRRLSRRLQYRFQLLRPDEQQD